MSLTTSEMQIIDRYKATEQYTMATWDQVRKVFADANEACALSLDTRNDPIVAWRLRTCNFWLERLEARLELLEKLRRDVCNILAQ